MVKEFLRFGGVDFRYEAAPELLLKNINLHLGSGWTGVVGANGTGKSTLLRLACGELRPSAGSVSRPPLSVYCSQRTDHPPPGLDELMTSSGKRSTLIKARLGLEEKWPEKWPRLSHGERKRLQTGAALFQVPDLLAVDEPTNHLDNPTRAVLLGALAGFRGIGLVVSHDRELLDRLCGAVVFMDPPRAVLRPGNYSQASQEAAREKAEQIRRREKAAQELNRLEQSFSDRKRQAARSGVRRSKRGLSRQDSDGRDKINRTLVSGQDAARGRLQRQIKGRLSQAGKRLEEIGFTKEHPAGIEVTGEVYRGDSLIRLDAGSKPLGPDRQVLHPSILIRPGQRIALTGPNGAGKSTLLRALVGAYGLSWDRLLYLPQEISARRSGRVLEEARKLKGDDLGWVMNMVSRLGSSPKRLLDSRLPSPGETRKLLLVLGLLSRPWLVVLDEPTNHLDLPSIQALETALAQTVSALVLASHDRVFLEALTDTEWRIEPRGEDYRLELE
jgi:macrolide transport system ATP-binding/permease protein